VLVTVARHRTGGPVTEEDDDMSDEDALAQRFERARPRLQAVATRILGSPAAAEDAVQESWLRLHHSDPDGIDNIEGWLTTVVSRICLDVLKSGRTRREQPVDQVPDGGEGPDRDPAEQAATTDAVGAALLVVLDQLGPTERLAFVLHDLFGVPFDEVAPIVGTTATNARQLASRARRKVRGGGAEPDRRRQRAVVDAFLEAAREGRFERLLTMLDPDIELRADAFSVNAAATRRHLGAPALASVMHGRESVAEVFSGKAAAARPAYVDGLPAAVWAPGGTTRSAWVLTIRDGVITRIEMMGDPATLAGLDVELL
jgi:RNA polymerase sigma factor (sigma-70 family)